jgi:hypothetical protein
MTPPREIKEQKESSVNLGNVRSGLESNKKIKKFIPLVMSIYENSENKCWGM